MPFKKIPKRLVIEMIERVIILLNSIPREGGIHQILSPREIVTGKRFHCPEWPIGQYGQGMTGGTNSIKKERSVDVLYLGRNDNRSGHLVFKLDTKLVISINSFTMINTPTLVIDRINKMGEDEKQPDGIEFMSDGILLFKDLYLNSNGNDEPNSKRGRNSSNPFL